MSNRINGFTVTLDKDYKDEDFEMIKNAILSIRGVLHVEENIVTAEDHYNRQVVRIELLTKLIEILK